MNMPIDWLHITGTYKPSTSTQQKMDRVMYDMHSRLPLDGNVLDDVREIITTYDRIDYDHHLDMIRLSKGDSHLHLWILGTGAMLTDLFKHGARLNCTIHVHDPFFSRQLKEVFMRKDKDGIVDCLRHLQRTPYSSLSLHLIAKLVINCQTGEIDKVI
jgi:hypothetical protein